MAKDLSPGVYVREVPNPGQLPAIPRVQLPDDPLEARDAAGDMLVNPERVRHPTLGLEPACLEDA